jgi:hypothetical protein
VTTIREFAGSDMRRHADERSNTPAQIDRIAEFLGVPLSAEKRAAVIDSVTFASMKQAGGLGEMLLRKGGYGDWKNHMGSREWDQVDAAFDRTLDGVALAEPLRHYQRASVGGFPPPRADQSLTVDPREWPQFVRHTLVEGRLVRDTLIAASGTSTFQRPPSEFNATIMPVGTAGAKHVAEAGRYHLFVSGPSLPSSAPCLSQPDLLSSPLETPRIPSCTVLDSGARWLGGIYTSWMRVMQACAPGPTGLEQPATYWALRT